MFSRYWVSRTILRIKLCSRYQVFSARLTKREVEWSTNTLKVVDSTNGIAQKHMNSRRMKSLKSAWIVDRSNGRSTVNFANVCRTRTLSYAQKTRPASQFGRGASKKWSFSQDTQRALFFRSHTVSSLALEPRALVHSSAPFLEKSPFPSTVGCRVQCCQWRSCFICWKQLLIDLTAKKIEYDWFGPYVVPVRPRACRRLILKRHDFEKFIICFLHRDFCCWVLIAERQEIRLRQETWSWCRTI